MPGRLTMPRGQSFQPREPLRGSQPTGRREGKVGGIEEAAIEFDLGIEAATGVEAGVSSAGRPKQMRATQS